MSAIEKSAADKGFINIEKTEKNIFNG